MTAINDKTSTDLHKILVVLKPERCVPRLLMDAVEGIHPVNTKLYLRRVMNIIQ